jgi:signal transduction histidine kinase
VLIAMAAILGISFLVFHLISGQMEKTYFIPVFERFDEIELNSAQRALRSGGKAALQEYMNNLDAEFGGKHYLLDAHGIDLYAGKDRSYLLPPVMVGKSRTVTHGHFIITHRSAVGDSWFVVEGQVPRPQLWVFLPYYFLVIGATAVLCWLAWIRVVLPIRRIGATIAAFGGGDLSLRIRTRREDEIGQLGRSFDRMAERLEQMILNRRRLLSDISHELRSPLARLKFAVKLARTSPDSQAALDRIERDIDRLASLVADIVEMTSVEDDPAAQETGPVRLREVIDEVVHDCSLEADPKGCRIAVTGVVTRPLEGNRELLRRAVENVLRNAIRYAPQGSIIQLTLAEAEGKAVIEVRDQGPGVPAASLESIFDPFFRVEEARVANGGGSGLGLSIARRAVQLHNGTIAAENAAPGLRVRMVLPLPAIPPLNLS